MPRSATSPRSTPGRSVSCSGSVSGRMNVPDDLRYTADHEWARLEDGRVRVGITDYAQDALGDVVFVQLPEVGAQVTAGGSFGEVESTKSVSDVYAPVSGTVVAVSCTLKSERPAITSVTASAAPLNGMCCASNPALARSRSAMRWS